MDTAKLTIRLPKNHLRSLQCETGTIHPEVEKISGLIPASVDARGEYRAYVLEKYR